MSNPGAGGSRVNVASSRLHNGSFIVYINNIEVPVQGVTVRYGIWSFPEISLDMAPDPVLQRFGAEDRVKVAVFFIDDYLSTESGEEAVPRLLAEGEIMGWQYTNAMSAGRSVIFNAADYMVVFTRLFYNLLTNVTDMGVNAGTQGNDVATITPARSDLLLPYSFFTEGLVGPDFINRPFDFVFNVVKAFTGKGVDGVVVRTDPANGPPTERRSIPAANFFAAWARKNNFINRFVATPVFDEPPYQGNKNVFPVLKALQTTAGLNVVVKVLMEEIQTAGSIWDGLKLVLETMYEELVMLPTAPLVRVALETNQIIPSDPLSYQVIDASDGTRLASLRDPKQPYRLANYFVKPQCAFSLPPACNIIFPSMIHMFQYAEDYSTQPTRLYLNDEVLNVMHNSTQGVLPVHILNALTQAYPPQADMFARGKRADARSTGHNFLIFPEEFFKGPVMDRRSMPKWLFFLQQAEGVERTAETTEYAKKNEAAVEGSRKFLLDESPDVYQLFCQYEYYRERYARRSGAVITTFNPFIVPGFPAIIFDSRASRFDIFCYVHSVEHNQTGRGLQTTIQYIYGRTLHEMFDLLKNMFDREKSLAFATAPREPVKTVRDTLQHFASAEDFYHALFYGRSPKTTKPASCTWTDVVGYAPDDPRDPPESIIIDGTNDSMRTAYNEALLQKKSLDEAIAALDGQIKTLEASIASYERGIEELNALPSKTPDDEAQVTLYQGLRDEDAVTLDKYKGIKASYQANLAKVQEVLDGDADKKAVVVHNLTTRRELVPMPGYEACFEDLDAAMQYVWRPICSLDEYIVFTGGVGENAVPAFGAKFSIGARYYERIGKLRPLLENFVLPPGVDGIFEDKPAVAEVPGIPSDFPNTRADWDSVLTAYRDNVYKTLAPKL